MFLLHAQTRGSGSGEVHFLLTVWLTPHISTLRSGSEARKSLTFWQTKCFFFVLVLEALSALPRLALTLAATVLPVQFEAMAMRGLFGSPTLTNLSPSALHGTPWTLPTCAIYPLQGLRSEKKTSLLFLQGLLTHKPRQP